MCKMNVVLPECDLQRNYSEFDKTLDFRMISSYPTCFCDAIETGYASIYQG